MHSLNQEHLQTEYVVQQVGKRSDENPNWPHHSWYVWRLLAVAGLSRVLEWWEAEKGFWNFAPEDEDNSEENSFFEHFCAVDALENNKQIPSPTIPHPTVSLLRTISSPSAFVNTNIGCITEHNERQHNYNSNDTSEDEDEEEEEEEDEDEGEENNVRDKVKAISVTMSDTQQQTSPNLNNYQGTSTKSETNPVDINMEANQDPIFEGEIEVISKEAFLKNITVANRHLSQVIDNPSLPLYIQSKIKEAIDLLRVDEEKFITGQPLPLDSNIKIGNSALLKKRRRPKNKQVLKNKKTFIAALETSSGQDNNVLTVDNSEIIPDSQSICINNPEIQVPQS
ncbi:hypothetical protein BY996DRAFT_6417798 [Phakopsora pachyrhizi]|nr:hypothetical protein BY996DRAFT_6417798 [Phakopsora pachyrhizi]